MKRFFTVTTILVIAICLGPVLVLSYMAVAGVEVTEAQRNAASVLFCIGIILGTVSAIAAVESKQ